MRKKNYNVVSIFDSSDEYVSLPYPSDLNNPRRSTNPFRFIPNVPILAKDTLLAQCLKSGISPKFLEKNSKTFLSSTIKHYRTIRGFNCEEQKVTPLQRKQLIGRVIGVEIEYYPEEKVVRNALTDIHHDGSLDDGGEEVTRLTWTNKDGRLQGLLNLKLKGKVNRKCGLHIHVDVRHLKEADPTIYNSPATTYDRIVGFYPFLKKLVPKSRLTNVYCEWVNNRDGSPDFICPAKGQRYAAANWCSFKEHSTIEFRCQGGTLNKVKIESWALLCQFIVNYCSRIENEIPSSWREFLDILPEPLKSWCFLRKEQLYGILTKIDSRAMSAMEN